MIRTLKNIVAFSLGLLIACLLFLLTGCAGQGVKLNVETENEKCGTKNVKFSTDYQVEQLEIGRTIEGGGTDAAGSEGCGGGYTVTLGKGTTKDAETGVMIEMMKTIRALMGVVVPGVPQASPGGGAIAPTVSYEKGVEDGRRLQTEEFNRIR